MQEEARLWQRENVKEIGAERMLTESPRCLETLTSVSSIADVFSFVKVAYIYLYECTSGNWPADAVLLGVMLIKVLFLSIRDCIPVIYQ